MVGTLRFAHPTFFILHRNGSTMSIKVFSAYAIFAALLIAPTRADDRIEIFDAHMHYNWEPKPYYQPDEVLEVFKRNRITGVLATSRPNTGTHVLMDDKAKG